MQLKNRNFAKIFFGGIFVFAISLSFFGGNFAQNSANFAKAESENVISCEARDDDSLAKCIASGATGDTIDISITASWGWAIARMFVFNQKNYSIHSDEETRTLTKAPNLDTTPFYIYGGGEITISNLIFDGENQIAQKSDTYFILFDGRNFENHKLTIENSVFQNNISAFSGGAIATTENTRLEISNSKFINNCATNGGALRIYGDAKISNSLFEKNSAYAGNGGAMIVSAIDTDIYSDKVEIKNSVFRENSAKNDGGAIGTLRENLANLTVDSATIFSANSAATFSRISPEDENLYNSHIFATKFSLAKPFNGYNNFDIQYSSAQNLPTEICEFDSELFKDDENCVEKPEISAPTNSENNNSAKVLSPNTGIFAGNY